MAPVALVERRVADDGVDGQPREGVGPQAVSPGHPHRGVGVQREPQRGERGEVGVPLLRVHAHRRPGSAQQPPGPGGGVEHGTGGPLTGGLFTSGLFTGGLCTDGLRTGSPPTGGRPIRPTGSAGRPLPTGGGGRPLHRNQARQRGHQGGGGRWGEGVLPQVGVQVPAQQEGVRLARAEVRGEFRRAAQQRHRGAEPGRVREVYGVGLAEPCGQGRVEGDRQHLGQLVIGALAQPVPDRGPVPDQQEDGPDLAQRGRAARRMPGEQLPDALAQRDLGELALGAQPALHVAEREGRAGLGAAHRLGEVGVAAAPVADGGAPHPGEPGDSRGGHLCCVVRHLADSVPWCCCGGWRPSIPTISTHRPVHAVNSTLHNTLVDAVHKLCSY